MAQHIEGYIDILKDKTCESQKRGVVTTGGAFAK
jgi:hypothetical protein